MKKKLGFVLVPLLLAFSSGCATRYKIEESPHTESLGFGRIEKRFDVQGDGRQKIETGRQKHDVAFAIFGSIADIVNMKGGYEISGIRKDQLITVFISQSFAQGDCVEILTGKENIEEHTFLLRKATLKKSNQCK